MSRLAGGLVTGQPSRADLLEELRDLGSQRLGDIGLRDLAEHLAHANEPSLLCCLQSLNWHHRPSAD
jgi:hypothetical protein